MRAADPFRTVLVISTGLLAGYFWSGSAHPALLYAALVIGLSGAASATLAAGIHRVWMKTGEILGLFIPGILLSLLYYLLLTPVAWLSRRFSHSDPLQLRNTRESMFEDTDNSFDADYFEKPW